MTKFNGVLLVAVVTGLISYTTAGVKISGVLMFPQGGRSYTYIPEESCIHLTISRNIQCLGPCLIPTTMLKVKIPRNEIKIEDYQMKYKMEANNLLVGEPYVASVVFNIAHCNEAGGFASGDYLNTYQFPFHLEPFERGVKNLNIKVDSVTKDKDFFLNPYIPTTKTSTTKSMSTTTPEPITTTTSTSTFPKQPSTNTASIVLPETTKTIKMLTATTSKPTTETMSTRTTPESKTTTAPTRTTLKPMTTMITTTILSETTKPTTTSTTLKPSTITTKTITVTKIPESPATSTTTTTKLITKSTKETKATKKGKRRSLHSTTLWWASTITGVVTGFILLCIVITCCYRRKQKQKKWNEINNYYTTVGSAKKKNPNAPIAAIENPYSTLATNKSLKNTIIAVEDDDKHNQINNNERAPANVYATLPLRGIPPPAYVPIQDDPPAYTPIRSTAPPVYAPLQYSRQQTLKSTTPPASTTPSDLKGYKSQPTALPNIYSVPSHQASNTTPSNYTPKYTPPMYCEINKDAVTDEEDKGHSQFTNPAYMY